MDFEDPNKTPTMAKENVASIFDWQQRAYDVENALNIETTKHERTKQASRRLQTAVDGYVESDFKARRYIQGLTSSNLGLSQELLRLRCVVDTLNGVLRMICDHSTCGNSCNDASGQEQVQ
jgi:hypothetical protein